MRVGILVNLHADMDLKEKFGELKEMGVESCQLVCWDRSLLNEETAAVVREAVREKGIEITAFWCGWEGPKVWNFYEGQETLGLVPQASVSGGLRCCWRARISPACWEWIIW